MDEKARGAEAPERVKDRSPWEQPTLTLLGKVSDLVQGGGAKTGTLTDPDVASTFKKMGGG